jgi:drug/metabolite transporter (DMT)-like permease
MAVWFTVAVGNCIVSKRIMTGYNRPSELVILQQGASFVLDFIVIMFMAQTTGITKLFKQARLAIQYTGPVALCLALARILTYASFNKCPASLVQTVKASSPVFAVIVSCILYRKFTSTKTVLALIPIIAGVVLCAVTEIEFDMLGFVGAVLSTLMGVLQTFASKRFLSLKVEKSLVLFHMLVCLASMMLVVPFRLLNSLQHMGTPPPIESAPATGGIAALLVISALCNWGQTMCSMLVLSRLSTLSHQVANVLRRLIVIVGSLLYFGGEITLLKMTGICLALGGFFLYKQSQKGQPKIKAKTSTIQMGKLPSNMV